MYACESDRERATNSEADSFQTTLRDQEAKEINNLFIIF